MTSILGAKLEVLLNEIRTIQPKTYIEIGCYQCDTMLEVQRLGIPRLIGFDLFEPAPNYEYPPNDGPPLTFDEASRLGLELVKGDTKETLSTLKKKRLKGPVVVFIDGGHSYDTTLRDIKQIREILPNAILLIDDISMPEVARAMSDSRLEWVKIGIEISKYAPTIT